MSTKPSKEVKMNPHIVIIACYLYLVGVISVAMLVMWLARKPSAKIEFPDDVLARASLIAGIGWPYTMYLIGRAVMQGIIQGLRARS
jgi:hypothetical protein